MIRACAWCDKARTPEQVAADAVVRRNQPVSHGCCPRHEAEVRAEMRAILARQRAAVAA